MEDAPSSTPEVIADKSAFEILKNTRNGVEEIVAKMLSLKKDDKLAPEIRELVTQMFLHFVSLRQVCLLLSSFLGFLQLVWVCYLSYFHIEL